MGWLADMSVFYPFAFAGGLILIGMVVMRVDRVVVDVKD